MSDIFREVEEEVRRERFEQIWKQYGDYIIAGVALIIIAVAGWQLWTRYDLNQRQKASETLIAAQQLADSGNFVKSAPAFEVLAKDGPGGYAKMAKLSQANALLRLGRRSEAVAIYKAVAADDGGPIGSLALVRAAWIVAEDSPRADVTALLQPISGADNPWRHSVREILAYADYHAGDIKKAQGEFQALADDREAPESLRRRVTAMAVFLKNGGMQNFGTVPPPAPPPAPAPIPGAPAAPAGTAPAAPAGATAPAAPPAPAPAAPAPTNGTPPK